MPRLQVRVLDDDGQVAREFARSVPTASEIRRVAYLAIGWMQTWADQATPEQIRMEARAREASR